MVHAGGHERVYLAFVGLHEPEQHSCIVEVVSILLTVASLHVFVCWRSEAQLHCAKNNANVLCQMHITLVLTA